MPWIAPFRNTSWAWGLRRGPNRALREGMGKMVVNACVHRFSFHRSRGMRVSPLRFEVLDEKSPRNSGRGRDFFRRRPRFEKKSPHK